MYKKVVIVGTGKFAFQCAKIAKQYCKDIFIFEHKINDNISVLEKLAVKAGISYYDMNIEMIYDLIRETVPDKVLVVSALNTYIFKKDFVAIDNVKIINFHPALLPKHPGRNAEAWAIYEMDSQTGVTWHIVSADVDKGDIIVQREIDIDFTMTSLELMVQQNNMGIKLFESIIPKIMQGMEKVEKQKSQKTKMHFSYEVPNDGYLDMNWSLEKKSAFLRCMDYGKLQVLGVPKIQIAGQVFTWQNYEIVDHVPCHDKQDADYVIEDEEKDIILKGMRRYQDG